MMTPARIVRFIGILGLLGWLGMVGWMAKTSQAQNGRPTPAPVPAQPPRKQAIAKKDAVPPLPIAPAAASAKENSPAHSFPKNHEAPPPIDPLPVSAEKVLAAPEPIATAEVTALPDMSPPRTDDPEKSAQSFMERSQKEAEQHLKALTAEAEQLRARLAKLDSGIKKWQGLLNALNAAQHGQPLAVAGGPLADEPRSLEPVAPSAAGEPADKQVKPASASTGTAGSTPQPAQASEPAAPAAPAPQPASPPAQLAAPTAAPR